MRIEEGDFRIGVFYPMEDLRHSPISNELLVKYGGYVSADPFNHKLTVTPKETRQKFIIREIDHRAMKTLSVMEGKQISNDDYAIHLLKQFVDAILTGKVEEYPMNYLTHRSLEENFNVRVTHSAIMNCINELVPVMNDNGLAKIEPMVVGSIRPWLVYEEEEKELVKETEWALRIRNGPTNVMYREMLDGNFSVSFEGPTAPNIVVKEKHIPSTTYGFMFSFTFTEKDYMAMKTMQILEDRRDITEEEYVRSLVFPLLEFPKKDPLRYEMDRNFYFQDNPYTHDRLSTNFDYLEVAKNFCNIYCRMLAVVTKDQIHIELLRRGDFNRGLMKVGRFPDEANW